jgi:dipeptide/tripeptide permease
MVLFFVGYEHSDSVWVYFARDYVDLRVPFTGRPLAPDQVQFLNPLCVVVFIPLLNALTRRADPEARVVTPSRKIVAGFVSGTAAVAVMAVAGHLAAGGGRVSIGWIACAYVLLTLGEVLVYATGLELAYAAAPTNMKGFVTACFLLIITIGNFVNVWLTPLYGGSLTDAVDRRGPLSPAAFFALTAGLMAVATFAFAAVGRRLLPPPREV